MSDYQTAKEAKRAFIERMGEPLGRLFHALWQEVAWLHLRWSEYVELFGTKPSRIDLLNDSAPRFFRMVHDSLWEDTILSIARLTDSPQSVGKKNLTIHALPDLVHDAKTRQSVARLVDMAVQGSDFCRDWRNRRIAHRDLKLAIEEGIEPLKPASRQKVKGALHSLSDVLNAVTQHYMGSTTMFDIGGGPGGAMSLLSLLDDGAQVEEDRRERMRRGEMREADSGRRDL